MSDKNDEFLHECLIALCFSIRFADKKTSLAGAASASGRNLWVSGLSSTTRATDLKQIFSKYGKVMGAKIVTNAKTPGARCYGYVTMSSSEDATKCIQHLNRNELHGRVISVEKVNFILFTGGTEAIKCVCLSYFFVREIYVFVRKNRIILFCFSFYCKNNSQARGDTQQSHVRKRDTVNGKSEKKDEKEKPKDHDVNERKEKEIKTEPEDKGVDTCKNCLLYSKITNLYINRETRILHFL